MMKQLKWWWSGFRHTRPGCCKRHRWIGQNLETGKTIVVPGPCDGEVTSYVVLRALKRLLHGYNDINVTGHSMEDLEKEQSEITRIRTWASTQNTPIRREYFAWLDHYQRNLNDAVRELRDQKHKKEMEDYRRENKELFDRVYACEATNTIPVPPGRS